MAQQQEDRIYDIYLAAFGKARAGVAMTSHDLEEKIPGGGYKPYKGAEMVAAALGVADGKASAAAMRSRADVHAAVAKQMA